MKALCGLSGYSGLVSNEDLIVTLTEGGPSVEEFTEIVSVEFDLKVSLGIQQN